MGMRKDNQNAQQGRGFLPASFRSLSGYLRIVSSGASSVASTVRSAASAASAIVERDSDPISDQVLWAGFDKLECEGNLPRQVLLLGYQHGFQVWDVEDANNVHNIVSRDDGAVSSMQILPKLTTTKHSRDEYANCRPLMVLCADGSFSAAGHTQDGSTTPCSSNMKNGHAQLNGGFVPTAVWFYSFKSQSYVHKLKLRSVVYSVRCSSRVVAVLQATQVHCFDAATLQRGYTILTNPITSCSNIGFGPLAVGPRWIAYSGSPVTLPSTCVSPQHLTRAGNFTARGLNGSIVAHYAKQSSKQLAAGIVTLGDIGYKKLSRYYSELLPDGNNCLQLSTAEMKDRQTTCGHFPEAENIGMVIVRDVVGKSVIAQFKAHDSPIASLCFDQSGTILVTASVQGHNFNVFRITPLSGSSSGPESGASYVHLYKLQRGYTNAVVQDISFSFDSRWIVISSSRGTSHLFAISPSGGPVNIHSGDDFLATNDRGYSRSFTSNSSPSSGPQMLNQQNLRASGHPVTLSAVSRIRIGNNGWRNMVTGAAIAASGAIASTFHHCKDGNLNVDEGSMMSKYHILVFSSTGCMMQYAIRLSSELDSVNVMSELNPAYESSDDCDSRLVVEPIQKWNLSHKHNRREREENVDIYGENGFTDNRKVFPEETKKENYSENSRKIKKDTVGPEERHHMYISEVELQMHQSRLSLWQKAQIHFQSLIMDDNIIYESNSKGEFEIEKIPAQTIESRYRGLVPAVDHLRGPKVQMTRIPALDGYSNDDNLPQRPNLFESGNLALGNSFYPLPLMDNCVVAASDIDNGSDKIGWSARMPPENPNGIVNQDDSSISHTRVETVNSREHFPISDLVNNNIEDCKMDNQYEDQGDEFN